VRVEKIQALIHHSKFRLPENPQRLDGKIAMTFLSENQLPILNITDILGDTISIRDIQKLV